MGGGRPGSWLSSLSLSTYPGHCEGEATSESLRLPAYASTKRCHACHYDEEFGLGETFDDDQGRASAGVMVVYGMRALLAWSGTGRHDAGGNSTLPIVSAPTVSPGGFDCVVMGHMPSITKAVRAGAALRALDRCHETDARRKRLASRLV
jgi:hypothetical protein